MSSFVRFLSRAAQIACLVFVFAATAAAIPMLGTDGTHLYEFDSTTPGAVTTVQITGLAGGDTIIGIDYAPSSGVLYAVSRTGRLYYLNLNGALTLVDQFSPDIALSGTTFGIDISPIDGQLRIVSNTKQNIRVELAQGKLAATDTPLNQSGTASTVGAIAFANSFPLASHTTWYGIGANDGQLLRIGSAEGSPSGPETGVITKIGSLNLAGPIDPQIGFDIAPNGVAHAAIRFGGQLRLYSINLSTGAATNLGTIAAPVASFTGLTSPAGPVTFNNLNTILLPDPQSNATFENPAAPYPSNISVSGLDGVIVGMALYINDFRHGRPSEIDMLLVSPAGQKMIMWSDVGGDFSTCGAACNNGGIPGMQGVFITLTDSQGPFMPGDDRLTNPNFNSAVHRPTNRGAQDYFPPPAPAQPYADAGPSGNATFANTFNGSAANGLWRLFIKDDENASNFTGRINGGWQIRIATAPPCTIDCPNDITMAAAPGQCGRIVNFPKTQVSGGCGQLTYSIPSGSFFPVGKTVVNVTSAIGQKCAFTVNVMDFQPPAITCPAGMTVQTPPGQSTAVVNYEAMASDNCSGVTVTYDPPSGSALPIGTTEVRATAADVAGESITCKFIVTVVSGGNPTPTPPPATPPTRLANISTRLRVETVDNVLIGGFIVTGAESKKLMLRAIGPSLPVEDRLLDPQLQLFSGAGDLIAENINWKDAPNQQELIDTSIAPSDDFESALLTDVGPGAYTAIVSGVNGGTGVGLVEAYDLSLNADSKLANIATRGFVQSGDDVMIGGFIIIGPNSQKLLVRGIGTSLPLENKLLDPVLELYNSSGDLVASNDNWRSDQEADIAATGIPPSEDQEAAVLATVPAAAYTALIRGASDTVGVAVVEVYAIDN